MRISARTRITLIAQEGSSTTGGHCQASRLFSKPASTAHPRNNHKEKDKDNCKDKKYMEKDKDKDREEWLAWYRKKSIELLSF